MRGTIGILFLFILPALAFGQTSAPYQKIRKNNLQLGIGFSHVRLIDEGFTDSKLLFRGNNTAFRLAYEREPERYVFNFAVAAILGDIKSKSGDLPSDFIFGSISAGCLRKIHSYNLFGKENKLLGGLRISTNNQALVSMRAIDNVSIFSFHGLYADIQNRLPINEKHAIRFSIALPLLVYENRVLWNGGASRFTNQDTQHIPRMMVTNGKFAYFNVLRNAQLDLVYVLKIGKHADMEARYTFLYNANFIEAPLRTYSNSLVVGLKFTF